MSKNLSEMTLDELWELFPIFLVPHDDMWTDSFNEIEKTLTELLADQPVIRISHIGSTAIQKIWAKNIVDVMVEIPQNADMKEVAQTLEQNDFIIMSPRQNESRSIRDILKMDLRTRCIISICDMLETMMNCTSVII